MSDELNPIPSPSVEALQQELAELEVALATMKQRQEAQQQEDAVALERERETYQWEQQELAQRQELILRRGQVDPFWWADGGYLGGEWS